MGEILRLSLDGAVKVDNVNHARAGLFPTPGHRRRVVGIDGFRGHIALTQTHTPSVLDVKGVSHHHALCAFGTEWKFLQHLVSTVLSQFFSRHKYSSMMDESE